MSSIHPGGNGPTAGALPPADAFRKKRSSSQSHLHQFGLTGKGDTFRSSLTLKHGKGRSFDMSDTSAEFLGSDSHKDLVRQLVEIGMGTGEEDDFVGGTAATSPSSMASSSGRSEETTTDSNHHHNVEATSMPPRLSAAQSARRLLLRGIEGEGGDDDGNGGFGSFCRVNSSSPTSRSSPGSSSYRDDGSPCEDSQQNLAPRGSAWQDDLDEDAYEYGGRKKKRVVLGASWGDESQVVFAVGASNSCRYCLGSVLRALKHHYGAICYLVLSAAIVVGFAAYIQSSSSTPASEGLAFGVAGTGGGVGGESPSSIYPPDLSDEDRYVLIRSHLVNSDISLHSTLPDDWNGGIDNYRDEKLSPQHRSLLWIADDDPLRLDVDDPELPQRYALAVLFHSTGGGEHNVTEHSWTELDGWLSGKDMCSWAGVECHIHSASEVGGTGGIVDMVREIRLPDNNLTGTIPREVGKALTHLSVLDLGGNNELQGSLPETIWELKDLAILKLNGLGLKGTLPPSVGALTLLRELDLSGNYLTGSLPSELGNATSLRSLNVSDNMIEGSIPATVGNLYLLSTLLLDSNDLTGPIPDDALGGGLENLIRLRLDQNSLTGPVPSETLSLPYLEEFNACSNELAGPLPSWTFDDAGGSLSELRTLDLCDNYLTGTIPPTLGNMRSLGTLALDANRFVGTIPSSLGDLIKLEVARFHGNELTGTVPEELCARKRRRENGEGRQNGGGGKGTETSLEVLSVDCGVKTGMHKAGGKVHCSCCEEDECYC